VPDFALVTGTPARLAGWMSPAGDRLDFDERGFATCGQTGERFALVDGATRVVRASPDAR
jgi:UDP-2-acetamido-3-amino-2,3-dideoxy-glucuronate N-acetyltransferase